LKAGTDRGDVYFKADYDKASKEVAVVLKLAQRWPENVPRLIAADVERNWMLMSDFGGISLQTLGAEHYRNAVSLYARMQRSSAPEIGDWKLLHCPDMAPENLFRVAGRLLDDGSVLGENCGINREGLAEFKRRMPQIEGLLASLSASRLPNTISNEDFRAGNIVVSGGEYIFYDWGSTVISHPLFGINYFFNRMPRRNSEDKFRWTNDLEDEIRRDLLSAFLAEWTDYAPPEQLLEEFWLCRRLYPLYEAVKCYCDIPYIGRTAPWGANALAYIPIAIRNLIAALDYQPESSSSPM